MLFNYSGYFSDHFNIHYEDLDEYAKKRLNVYNNAFNKIKIFEPEFYNNLIQNDPENEQDIKNVMFNRAYLYRHLNDDNLPSNRNILDIPKSLFLDYLKDLILKVKNVFEIEIFNCNCHDRPRLSALANSCDCTDFDFCIHAVHECRCFITQEIYQKLTRHITDEELLMWYQNV